MAKKKKGIGASFRQQVEQVPVVQQKAPRTISTNVSTGGGGLGASLRSDTKTATQKAEEERSARMRQGLSKTFSSVVRASFNNQRNVQPTTVKKGLYSNLRNQLAPVKHNANYTRSQQNEYLNTELQRKGLNTPMSQLMAGKTNVGVEQGKALRAGMPTNSNVIESWRRTASDAEKKAREKYGYAEDFNRKQIDERLDNSGKREVFDPSNGKITTALPAKFNAVAPNEVTYKAGDALRGMRWDDIRSGFADAFARKNVEDTAERQFGRTVDDDTLARLEEQRSTLGYGTGMAAGQMAQYALTRGLLSGAGLVGRGAKAADTAGKAFRAEMAIDQASSVPLNIIDAMKEDNLEGIIKRFGINQGLDLVFGAFTEGISIKRNPLYQNAETKHIAAKEARQAGDNAAANALDQSARRDLGAISNAELDEARNDIVARVGEQRRIINDEQVNAIQNAEGTVGEFPSTDYAYRNGSDRANYDNMRDDMLGAIESQEAIGAGNVPNNIGMRADVRPYESTRPQLTGIDKVLADYNMSADELIERLQDPSFNDWEMLEDIANDIVPVGRRRGISIDAERQYADNVKNYRQSARSADSILGSNDVVPTKDQITSGNASYGGIPLKYKPGMHAEAENYTTEIWVSSKFFDLSPENQRHVLNHEVAHNYADDLMGKNTGNWNEFADKFIKEKNVPVDSPMYKNGARTYWEGLYGDIGATSLSETVTRAITEYLDNPSALRNRSAEAFDVIDNYMLGRTIPSQSETYRRMLSDSVIDELRRSQTPNVADDVARAVPAEQTAREATQQTTRAVPAENTARRAAAQSAKNESVEDATERLIKKWGNTGNEASYREIVKQYNGMSAAELKNEKEALQRMANTSSIDPDEAADRIAVIDAISREKNTARATEKTAEVPKAKTEEPKAEAAAKKEVFVSEEQVNKAFNDAIRKRSYRFETLRAYPRSGDMRIIIGDRVYDERGFRRLIREDLERTKAQVNEALNARAAKVGKQKASAEEPKTEPKVKPQVEEPKKRNQVNGILNNEEPKAKANATEEPKVEPREDNRTWQEHAREDYKTGKQRAEGVKKGKIPSRENGEVVNAIKRLKETKDFADIKDVLDRGVKDGLYNRKIKHLDEGIDNAIKEIEEDPEKVINEILEYHPNGAKANDVPADAVPWVMKGYALCKWADQNGMKALKEDIAATMAKAQSTGGSILRAGQVFTVMADSKTQRDLVADFVEKMQTKYAKRLGDHKLTVPEDLLKKLDDATTEAEKSKILDDISVHVWNQVPQSFFDALSGLRIISMLANTTTMVRNVASNVAFAGVREVDKTINTVMEATAEKLGKIDREHRSHTIYNHFSKENRKIQAFWYNDYGKNNNVIKGQSRWNEGGGTLNVDIRHENARHYGVKAGGGKKGGLIGGASSGIEAVRKATSFLMDKGDEIFLAPAYSDAATQMMVVRGWSIDDLTPTRIQEIREYATEVAQKATYRDPSDAAMALAKWGHWQKGDGGFRLLRAVLVGGIQPFKKTPINIGKRSLEYSPLGFAKGVYDIGKAVHAGDSKAVNKAITELSKGTTGTGLVVAGYLLAQQGLVNAKLPTDDEGYLRKDLGEQDYALTLNGKSRTLQWAAPGAVPILAGATLYDQIRQRGWNSLVHPAALVSVLSKSADPLLEMSFMQSYMDIADVTDDVKGVDKILVGVEQIGLSYAAQFIPTILGKVANMVDPVRRDTSSQATDPYEKALERFINKSVINKIPNVGKAFGKEWGSASLPAYIDYKGDEQKTEDIKDRIIENFISPWYTKDIKNDPVAKEVIKVNKASDENILLSSSMGNGKHELKLDGKTINLDSHEMEQYKRLKGKANYNNVKKLMNSAEYKSMTMSEKGKAIKQEEDAAKLEAKQKTLLKMGKDEWKVYTDDFSGRKTEYQDAKDADLKAKQYYDYMTTKDWDLDESGKPVKSELALYLNNQDDLSDEQRAVIFSKLASGNTKNPYEDGTAHTTDWQAEYDKYLAKKNKDKDGSSSSKSSGGSKKGRSGRRSGGGGGSSKTKARAKTESEKKFAALQKMKAPTTGKGIEALSQGAKGLTKAQKKALLKLMQKKLEV